MNRIISALTLTSAFFCFAGCAGNRVEHTAQPITIRVAGSTGASFTGTVKANGVTQKVSGTVPSELHFEAARLTGSFQQGAEMGTVRFEILEGERLVGGAGTTGPWGHCRFTLREGGLGSRSSWRFVKE